MSEPVGIFLLGTAGCGKSTLTAAMANWMAEGGMPFQLVNLDPGADLIPYEPDVDVRDWITLADVMEEYGLGPNGAQIVAADMLALYKKRIMGSLEQAEGRYILFDTPGQMELFTFREASRDLVSSLVPNPYLLYLIDPFNARTPSGLISQIMLSSLARLRFMVPSVEVMSKSDMIEPDHMDQLNDWQTYPEHLMEAMLEESRKSPSMSNEFVLGINRVIEELGLTSNIVPVSSAKGIGLEKIYEVVQLTYGGGEDLVSRDPENEDI